MLLFFFFLNCTIFESNAVGTEKRILEERSSLFISASPSLSFSATGDMKTPQLQGILPITCKSEPGLHRCWFRLRSKMCRSTFVVEQKAETHPPPMGVYFLFLSVPFFLTDNQNQILSVCVCVFVWKEK